MLIVAAQAMGFGANWITDWYAYDPQATALLGLADDELVAGFVHIGTAAEDPAGAGPAGHRGDHAGLGALEPDPFTRNRCEG